MNNHDWFFRTAADFGSALDSVWPFFGGTVPYKSLYTIDSPMISAKGCKRTTKADLIAKKIVKKVRVALTY